MVRASSSISAHPGKSGGAYPALVMSYRNCSWFTSCSSLSEQPANKPTTAANAASTAILFMAPPALCTAYPGRRRACYLRPTGVTPFSELGFTNCENRVTSQGVSRVAVYARISQDPLGLEKGVERQIKEAKDLAKQRGWHVVRVYRDNDISALRGAFRPEYAQMLEDAKSGLFDRIVAFQLSRLWRNRRERADAIELLSALRVPITLVRGADIDLT